MQVWRSVAEVDTGGRPAVVTIGNFDGVHIGHRHIFAVVGELAAHHRGWRVALTFDPHPVRVLTPSRPFRLLTPFPERLRLFASAGLEATLALPFDAATAALSPQDFVERIVVAGLRAVEVVIGGNFRFGHRQAGNVDLLWELGARLGFAVKVVEAVQFRGGVVSSTRIRNLIEQGRVSAAARLLGRWYEIEGRVAPGRGIGRVQTVPTLNMAPYPETLPQRGVYITETQCGGLRANSVTNIGMNPTFGATELHVESHFLDPPPAGWTPGETLRVAFCHRLRDEIQFPSAEALRARIGRDIAAARKFFAARVFKHG
jgi:riboflavin kinase/FMN adenylyltransferase